MAQLWQLLSQKVTYLFCDELDIVSKSLWAELGKQQKMLLSLRSNPQTESLLGNHSEAITLKLVESPGS